MAAVLFYFWLIAAFNVRRYLQAHLKPSGLLAKFERMDSWARAALIAVPVEVALGVATFAGGWGPCGPGTPLGLLGLLLHIFPGILIGWGIETLGAPSWFSLLAMIASQYLCWALIARVWLARREDKRNAH